jgi:ABC-type nitrate/sulfonate/bicarbonate transport system substrate-binding protein
MSQLQPWKLTREKPEVMLPVGITQNPADPEVETLWLADEKYGNPYLRIAAEAGIFQKNGINLRIRELEPDVVPVLSKILSGGTQLAKINLDKLDKRYIPRNARLVSFSSGIYARVLSSAPNVSSLSDLSGKTVGTAGFSEMQVELIKDRLRTELAPKFSGVTIVNVKDSNPLELNNVLEEANADVFLLHPTATQSFTGIQYRYITNIKQPVSAIFMIEDLQKQKPAVAERFLLSHVESIEYFRKNRAAVIVHLMEHSPDLKVTEAARVYDKLLRELPARADDTFPTASDIKLFTRQGSPTGAHHLDAIVEQGFIKNAETKAAIVKSLP